MRRRRPHSAWSSERNISANGKRHFGVKTKGKTMEPPTDSRGVEDCSMAAKAGQLDGPSLQTNGLPSAGFFRPVQCSSQARRGAFPAKGKGLPRPKGFRSPLSFFPRRPPGASSPVRVAPLPRSPPSVCSRCDWSDQGSPVRSETVLFSPEE